MPLPASKAELVANLTKAYKKLDAEFDDIAVELERECGIEGDVSCCDIVAYQIGWGELLLGWDKSELAGVAAVMPAAGFKWNQLGDLAISFYQTHRDLSLAQLRDMFFQLFQDLCYWIDNLTEQELFEPLVRQWTGDKWAMVKWIQINTIAPYQSARTKVRRWKRTLVAD